MYAFLILWYCVISGSCGIGIYGGGVSSGEGGGAVMVFVAVMEAPPLECEDSGWCSCKTKLLKRLKNKIESVELQWGGGDTER